MNDDAKPSGEPSTNPAAALFIKLSMLCCRPTLSNTFLFSTSLVIFLAISVSADWIASVPPSTVDAYTVLTPFVLTDAAIALTFFSATFCIASIVSVLPPLVISSNVSTSTFLCRFLNAGPEPNILFKANLSKRPFIVPFAAPKIALDASFGITPAFLAFAS